MITPVAPAYTIAKANQRRRSTDPKPGPTDYDTSFTSKAAIPAYSFNRSPRQIHKLSINPGPGKYLPDILLAPKGFTISRSPRALSNVRTLSPGPGDYKYDLYQAKYQYSISKAKNKTHFQTESPGPGYYSPNLDLNEESSPRVKFLTQPKMVKERFITPAPGQYEIPGVDKLPSYSFAKAANKAKDNIRPGPGDYSTPLNTIGIGSGRRVID